MLVTFTADQIRVANNLRVLAEKWEPLCGVPPLATLSVTYQEDGWQDSNPGDGGESNGPFQIYSPAHPGVCERIKTSPWYDYGFPEIYERWREQWQPYAAAWTSGSRGDRIAILVSAAPQLQGSIPWTLDQGVAAYDAAVAVLELLS